MSARTQEPCRTVAIVLAGGAGKRMQSSQKKQFLQIGGKELLYYSLKTMEESFIDDIVIVTAPEDREHVQKDIVEACGFSKVRAYADGGRERYHSVANGLRAAEQLKPAYVFIHDCARPFVSPEILERALSSVKECGACVVGMPVKDTIKIADAEGNIQSTPDRSLVWQIQTPQVFSYEKIAPAYEKVIREEDKLLQQGIHITDDAMVLELYSKDKIRLVEGSYDNFKVTTPEDISLAENFLSRHPNF
ncbi:MAG: 2-C-methyl-D-erythritol 4-phosphate cytidylyltransferase [Lachnospiraceae bacterium]|nr:2-C-methyl-D-erythritol 4-phosphate cytidylyltransferase [Lachnospiraceae bacterium]